MVERHAISATFEYSKAYGFIGNNEITDFYWQFLFAVPHALNWSDHVLK